jgi:hypothetical protein
MDAGGRRLRAPSPDLAKSLELRLRPKAAGDSRTGLGLRSRRAAGDLARLGGIKMTIQFARLCAVSACALVASVSVASAQPATVHIQEGTELRIHFNDKLSSKTASEGDRFSITLDEPVVMPDGLKIPAGYRGVGEVTDAEKRGMMGKPGQLNVRFDYLKIGDARVHLRGSKGEEGKSRVGTTVVLTVLFGPLGLLKHGKDVEIPRGQPFTVYVDQDVDIPAPLAPPPHED